MRYLDDLNGSQRVAVEQGDGPILILAGAGSGKTRVLTCRLAHLIFKHGIDPRQIFAVTFTNKAAAEMRHRVSRILAEQGGFYFQENEMWVSTFHSACVRILRSEIHHLGMSGQFTIYDDADQRSVIKACLKEMNISDSALSPKALQGKINRCKNDGIDFNTYKPTYGSYYEDIFIRVFGRYTEVLTKSAALDFADLILTTVKLFEKFPDTLMGYQKRFPHILIDEYQDTNRCQYLLLKQMAGENANICAVGDEDQSIYRWRGADIANILNFEKDYPNAKIFKLEQNYRSTKNIIEAASHVISNNTERRDKTLWTDNAGGEKISVLESYDEHDEALKVSVEVMGLMSKKVPLNEIAVFYRTNAQSRLLEDMFRAKGINYEIFGGLKFYERLEVKDTVAYLRLLANPDDDVSFRRIINVPTRGIGAVSLERLEALAEKHSLGLYNTVKGWFSGDLSPQQDLARGQKSFKKFYDLMEHLGSQKDHLLPSDLMNLVLESSGYRKALVEENTVESISRLENLAELRQSVVEYELRVGAESPDRTIRLEGFLEEIALVSDIDRYDPAAPAVKMMTIHMAKGLEFDVVFMVGLEEELFPNIRPWESEEPSDVEEERRLFYVGMTRARKKLVLLYSDNRTVFGNVCFRVRSRFIEEIPLCYMEVKKADYFSRRRPYIDRPGLPQSNGKNGTCSSHDEFSQVTDETDDVTQDFSSEQALRRGSHVVHPTFGQGIVKGVLGKDKLLIDFAGRGTKKISLKFCQLKGL